MIPMRLTGFCSADLSMVEVVEFHADAERDRELSDATKMRFASVDRDSLLNLVCDLFDKIYSEDWDPHHGVSGADLVDPILDYLNSWDVVPTEEEHRIRKSERALTGEREEGE